MKIPRQKVAESLAVSIPGRALIELGDGFNSQCGRGRWRVGGSVWAVAMKWRVSGGDPQVFRFICFYS